MRQGEMFPIVLKHHFLSRNAYQLYHNINMTANNIDKKMQKSKIMNNV